MFLQVQNYLQSLWYKAATFLLRKKQEPVSNISDQKKKNKINKAHKIINWEKITYLFPVYFGGDSLQPLTKQYH